MILFHEHEKELMNEGDKVTVLFSEVMFDKVRKISGHNPAIIRFIYKTKKKFESWGYEVNVLHSDKDYLDVFYHKLTRSPDKSRVGLTHGFVPSGKCAVKRDCKLRPINEWHKEHSHENIIDYVGIAIDEPKRLESLHKNNINSVSLLEKYNFTEEMAMYLCRKYKLVSPQYSMPGMKRDGCWFCPNAKLCEHAAIAKAYPEVWKQYVEMESEPDLAYPKWNVFAKETLHERDLLIKSNKVAENKEKYRQMTIWDLIDVA